MGSDEAKVEGDVVREPSELDVKLLEGLGRFSAFKVSQLLMAGASPNALAPSKSEAGRALGWAQRLDEPALLVAIEAHDGDAARVLLAAGADPNGESLRGLSVLDAAIDRLPDLCMALIEAGADIHRRSCFGVPLTKAVEHGRLDLYKEMVERGADPWVKDSQGSTGPMSAARWGQLPMLAHLLSENRWVDEPREPSFVERHQGGAPLEARACALQGNWGSSDLGPVAARLIDAARAIRKESEASGEGATDSKINPIPLAQLYARAEAGGWDLLRESAVQFAILHDNRDCDFTRKDGEQKLKGWLSYLLSTHPAWLLGGDRLAEAVDLLASGPRQGGRDVGASMLSALENMELRKNASPAVPVPAKRL